MFTYDLHILSFHVQCFTAGWCGLWDGGPAGIRAKHRTWLVPALIRALFLTLLEYFQKLFFFFSCPQSFSLWQYSETYERISVNTSDVVPEFKSFLITLAEATWGCLCDGKEKLFRNWQRCICVRYQSDVCVCEQSVCVLLAFGNLFICVFFLSFFYSLCGSLLSRRFGADVHLQGYASHAFLSIFTWGWTC